MKEVKPTKRKIDELREEVSEIKGRDLEKTDIASLIIEEEKPKHLWLKKEEGKKGKKEEKDELKEEDKLTPFREGHWDKTEKQKKENKMSALNLNIKEKPLHPEEKKEPEEKKQILEMLKQSASKYKKIDEIKTPKKEGLFQKGKSEEMILEKKDAGKIMNKTPEMKKKVLEEEMLKEFILEKPQRKEKKPEMKKNLAESRSEFQDIQIQEEEKPKPKIFKSSEQRLNELDELIPSTHKKVQEEKKPEENLTVAQQIGNVTGFFTRNIAEKMGVKQVDKKVLDGLSKEEIKKAKKLASSLEVAAKKYTKEEIIDALQLEGHSKKMVETVIKIIYGK